MTYPEEEEKSEQESLLEEIGHLSRYYLELQEKVKNRQKTQEEVDLERVKADLDSRITSLVECERSGSASSFDVPPENTGFKSEFPHLGIKLSRSEGSLLVPDIDMEKLRTEIGELLFVEVTDIVTVLNEKKIIKAIRDKKITLNQISRSLKSKEDLKRRKTVIKITPLKENEE